jgi:hypothetical protein
VPTPSPKRTSTMSSTSPAANAANTASDGHSRVRPSEGFMNMLPVTKNTEAPMARRMRRTMCEHRTDAAQLPQRLWPKR